MQRENTARRQVTVLLVSNERVGVIGALEAVELLLGDLK